MTRPLGSFVHPKPVASTEDEPTTAAASIHSRVRALRHVPAFVLKRGSSLYVVSQDSRASEVLPSTIGWTCILRLTRMETREQIARKLVHALKPCETYHTVMFDNGPDALGEVR